MSTGALRMLDRCLTNEGHVRRFVIQQMPPLGWEVREEEDSRIVRSVRYTDWHRVERARTMMSLKMSDLSDHGWVDA